MKILLFGSGEFALPSLEALVRSPHSIVAVVTQPDRPRGRGLRLEPTPMKSAASAWRLPIASLGQVTSPEAKATIRGYAADVFVVIAFGQILDEELIAIPPMGAIGVHASLLPKYRGAAPIQWAIIRGELETGVTVYRLNEQVDAGEMLLAKSTPIEPEETSERLAGRLAEMGAEALLETLQVMQAGTLTPLPQGGQISMAPKLKKSDGLIHWDRPAEELARLVRGTQPWPCAYTFYHGRQLKVFASQALVRQDRQTAEPGAVVEVGDDAFAVATGRGELVVRDVQLEGSKRMPAAAFLAGHHLAIGDRLGA